LRLIAGLEQPDSGAISIGGTDVTNLTSAQRKISMVFQSYALFPHLSVAENIVFDCACGECRELSATNDSSGSPILSAFLISWSASHRSYPAGSVSALRSGVRSSRKRVFV
jgi:ABC-type sulfate/molybdate transport systems ATPase subunit